MANKPKQQGTNRETLVVRDHVEAGLKARRDENNSACSDVVVETGAGPVRVEVKDRQNLNAHALMKRMLELYPDDFNVLWFHRTSKKNGNARKSPDGPDLVHMTGSDWLQVAVLIDRVGKAKDELGRGSMPDGPELEQLLEWVTEALPVQIVATA